MNYPGALISIFLGLVCLTTNLVQTSAGKQNEGELIIVRLSEDESNLTDRDKTLSTIEVELALKQHQRDASKGLQASVIFRNPSAQPVLIRNPLDSTQLEIFTEDGWPIQVLRNPPESLIHRIPTAENPKPSPTIRIAPGDEYRLQLNISRIFPVERSGANNKAQNSGSKVRILIPPGNYMVKVTTTLIPDSMESAGTARKLSSKLVKVQLGS